MAYSKTMSDSKWHWVGYGTTPSDSEMPAGSTLINVSSNASYVWGGTAWYTAAASTVTLASTAQVTGTLTISSGSVTLAATAQVTLIATAQITGTVTVSAADISEIGSASFTMTAVTAGTTVSATFTGALTGYAYEYITISTYNSSTCDLTANLYAVETALATASANCLIGSLSLTKSAGALNMVTGAFCNTSLLVQMSPDADNGATTASCTMRVRGTRRE